MVINSLVFSFSIVRTHFGLKMSMKSLYTANMTLKNDNKSVVMGTVMRTKRGIPVYYKVGAL